MRREPASSRVLERHAGRERFDRFMRKYIETFRFTSITSEEFLAFLEQELPGTAAAVQADAWLYETGMPSNAPVFKSERLDELTAAAEAFAQGSRPAPQQAGGWDSNELLVFLQHLPRQLDHESLAWLDQNFKLTQRGNYEILVEWLTIAAGSDYEPVFDSCAGSAAGGRPDEIPPSALLCPGQASPHPRPGQGDLRAGESELSHPLAPRNRIRHGEIR